MSSPTPRPLEDHLCFAVYAANHAFAAAYKPLLEPLGLTYPQYLVMLVLWQADGPVVKEIGGRLQLDSGTLTPLLKRMEAAGLLRRERDAEDERLVRIRLTPAGRALQAEAVRLQAAMLCSTGETEAALAALRASLATLAGRLRAAAEAG
jgi:DNA-binding MarR family transcriptional regulator